jgi:PAS domain S-box-containing protein
MAGLIALYLVTASMAPDALQLAHNIRLERRFMDALAEGWFAIAFWRRHPLARSVGGRVIVSFTVAYTLHHVAQAMGTFGLPPYHGGYTVYGAAMPVVMAFGIAGGMIVLASEGMVATTKSLRDSEERYRTLVEASPDGIVATDRAGTILMCNRRAAELQGYADAAQLLRKPLATLVSPADRERVQAEAVARPAGGQRASLECQIVLDDGSRRSVELTAAPLHADDGAIAGIVMILHDATERKEADRALRREREFSAHVIDAIPGIFFVLDRERKYSRWNHNLEHFLGLAAERIPAADALARFHPDDRGRVSELIERVFEHGSGEAEARSLAGGGEPARYFYLTGRRMESDAAAYVVGCGVDITERKEAEIARARLESQLLQSQRLESIGRLAGGVAHDFNNHLTVINGYCDLILMGLGPGDPYYENLRDIRRAGERAATLTRQLLAFGRKQLLSPSPLSLNQIVSSMERMLNRLMPENIVITAVLAPGLGAAMADTGQIEQVLMNLVVNARDAMPEGGTILIETANLDLEPEAAQLDRGLGPGAYVTLSITDTGVGMDERTRALIFEPFFTTKELGKGTGLGLAMVYGIVKQSGGSIAVRSAPGEGATFTVYLRRLDAPVGAVTAGAEAERSRSGQGTILVVEDQDAVRSLVANILRSYGYQVMEADSGAQALALPDKQVDAIDLLVTDVVMPGMSGRDLATRLAARRKGLRVLYMSGYAADAIVHEGILDADVAFLQKPFSPAEIAAKAEEMLSAR